MEIKLTEYIPQLDELDNDSVAEVLSRYRALLANEYPDLKTSPNSVFGEFFLKPLAQLVAAFELGAERFTSDFDMENVAEGTIWNCDVVKMFLKNLGIQENFSTPVIGTVRISFSENKQYVLDPGSRILFGDNQLFNFIAPYTGNIVIDPVGSVPSSGNWKSLTQTDTNTYSVDLTVIGPATANVSSGTEATTDIPDTEIRNITAIGNFTEGVLSESVPELASLASKIFSSASLTTRGGTISFLLRQFPHINVISPVISGDLEMQRDKRNVLGFSDGRIDIHVKQETTLLTENYPVLVCNNGGTWQGKLNTTNVPLYIDGFKLATADNNYLNKSLYTILGRSSDNARAYNASSSYSELEELGIETTANVNSVAAASITNTPAGITLTGNYAGHVYSNTAERNLTISITSFDDPATDHATATITDTLTGITTSNAVFDASGTLDLTQSDETTNLLTAGLTVNITDTWDNTVVGNTYESIQFNAEYGYLHLDYRYDPIISQVTDIVKSPDVQPAIDTLVKGPITCKVDELTVFYRKKNGSYVDRELAKQEIYNYVNSIGYSEAYEQSAIIDIMLYAGAIGVRNIVNTGVFYPTLADKYTKEGVEQFSKDAAALNTTTLLPDSINTTYQNDILKPNGTYVGLRNVHYILDMDDITVTEIKY